MTRPEGDGDSPAAHGRTEADVSTEPDRETGKSGKAGLQERFPGSAHSLGKAPLPAGALASPTLGHSDTAAAIMVPSAQACEL